MARHEVASARLTRVPADSGASDTPSRENLVHMLVCIPSLKLEETRQAMENASFEMETRRSEFDDNRKRMEVLTKENNELIKRIMEMKEEQAKQMNQVNDVYHTVIQSAKVPSSKHSRVSSPSRGKPRGSRSRLPHLRALRRRRRRGRGLEETYVPIHRVATACAHSSSINYDESFSLL